jgi:hypothetical protein
MAPVMAAHSGVLAICPTRPQLASRCTLLQQRRFSHALVTPLSAPRRDVSLRITAHGTGAATASAEGKRRRPGERKGEYSLSPPRIQSADIHPQIHGSKHVKCGPAGFVEEMRIVAMKLHTKDQAPKEGEQKAAEKPFPKVSCTLGLKSFTRCGCRARRCATTRFVLPRCMLHGSVQGHRMALMLPYSGSLRGRATSSF